MGIHYDDGARVFKLDTAHTSYVIAITDEENFIGHAYYGASIRDMDVSYLMRTKEAPFVPSQNNRDRSSFLDTFPMEYPGNGVGDYRESAIAILDENGNTQSICIIQVIVSMMGKREYRGSRQLSEMRQSVVHWRFMQAIR